MPFRRKSQFLIDGVMLFSSVYLTKYIYIILILKIGMLFLIVGSFIYLVTILYHVNTLKHSLQCIWNKTNFNIKNTFSTARLTVYVVFFSFFCWCVLCDREEDIDYNICRYFIFLYYAEYCLVGSGNQCSHAHVRWYCINF